MAVIHTIFINFSDLINKHDYFLSIPSASNKSICLVFSTNLVGTLSSNRVKVNDWMSL